MPPVPHRSTFPSGRSGSISVNPAAFNLVEPLRLGWVLLRRRKARVLGLGWEGDLTLTLQGLCETEEAAMREGYEQQQRDEVEEERAIWECCRV